jgi:transcription elongation factor Elf1
MASAPPTTRHRQCAHCASRKAHVIDRQRGIETVFCPLCKTKYTVKGGQVAP